MNDPIKINSESRGAHRVPWLTIATAAVCAVLFLISPVVFDALVFDRVAVGRGEWWRMLTGHFVHCSFEHLFWDLAALLVLGSVIELTERRAYVVSLLGSSLVLGAWLMLSEAHIIKYCGLSGALNGLLSMAAVMLWNKTRERIFILVLFAAVAKILFECLTHLTVFTSLSSQAVPAAHAVGLLAGLFLAYVRNLGGLTSIFVSSKDLEN